MNMALWLIPEGEVFSRMELVISSLADRFDGPLFVPHVTLLGGISGVPEEVIRIVASVSAKHLDPFDVILEGIGYTDEYFRSLFLMAGRSDALMHAYCSTAEALAGYFSALEEPFMPHMSIMYGEQPLSDKERIVAELGGSMDTSFTARALFLYRTDGEPADWVPVARFMLEE